MPKLCITKKPCAGRKISNDSCLPWLPSGQRSATSSSASTPPSLPMPRQILATKLSPIAQWTTLITRLGKTFQTSVWSNLVVIIPWLRLKLCSIFSPGISPLQKSTSSLCKNLLKNTLGKTQKFPLMIISTLKIKKSGHSTSETSGTSHPGGRKTRPGSSSLVCSCSGGHWGLVTKERLQSTE